MHISGLGLPLMRCCCLRSDASPNRVCVCPNRNCHQLVKKQTKKKKKNKKNSHCRVADQIKKEKKEKRISPLPADDVAPWRPSSRTDQSFGLPTLRVMALRPCGPRALNNCNVTLQGDQSFSVRCNRRQTPTVCCAVRRSALAVRAPLPRLYPCTFALLHLHFCTFALHFCTFALALLLFTFALAHPCGAQHLAVHAPLPRIGPTAKSSYILTTPFQEVVFCSSTCSSSNLLVGPCQT